MRVQPEQNITPDQYELFTYTKDGLTTYHIFVSWKGGYLHGDSWRKSSPIVRVEDSGENYKAYTQSGSEYVLNKQQRHVTGYNASVLASMMEMHDVGIIDLGDMIKGVNEQ